jgi:drug/metabolite transporter (DMT)-like permease
MKFPARNWYFASHLSRCVIVTTMCFLRADSTPQGTVGTRLIYHPFGGTSYCIKVVVVRGIVGAAGFCLAYYAISVLALGDAVATLSLYPIPTILMGRFLLQEEIGLLQLSSVVLSVAGAFLIAQPSAIFGGEASESLSRSTMGYVTGILGSCAAAGVVILIRKAGLIGAHTLQLLFSWVFFGVLFSGMGIFIQQWKVPPNLTCWLYILGMSIFGSLAHVLLNYAGRLVPAGASSIMRSTNVVWAYTWEIFIFHVHPAPWTWFGVVLIGTSLILAAWQQLLAEQSQQTLATTMLDETSHSSDDTDDDLVELPAFTSGTVNDETTRYVKVPSTDNDIAR